MLLLLEKIIQLSTAMDLEFIAKLYAANKHACLFPALKLV